MGRARGIKEKGRNKKERKNIYIYSLERGWRHETRYERISEEEWEAKKDGDREKREREISRVKREERWGRIAFIG